MTIRHQSCEGCNTDDFNAIKRVDVRDINGLFSYTHIESICSDCLGHLGKIGIGKLIKSGRDLNGTQSPENIDPKEQ